MKDLMANTMMNEAATSQHRKDVNDIVRDITGCREYPWITKTFISWVDAYRILDAIRKCPSCKIEKVYLIVNCELQALVDLVNNVLTEDVVKENGTITEIVMQSRSGEKVELSEQMNERLKDNAKSISKFFKNGYPITAYGRFMNYTDRFIMGGMRKASLQCIVSCIENYANWSIVNVEVDTWACAKRILEAVKQTPRSFVLVVRMDVNGDIPANAATFVERFIMQNTSLRMLSVTRGGEEIVKLTKAAKEKLRSNWENGKDVFSEQEARQKKNDFNDFLHANGIKRLEEEGTDYDWCHKLCSYPRNGLSDDAITSINYQLINSNPAAFCAQLNKKKVKDAKNRTCTALIGIPKRCSGSRNTTKEDGRKSKTGSFIQEGARKNKRQKTSKGRLLSDDGVSVTFV